MLEGVAEISPEKLFSMQEEVMRLTRLVQDLRDLSLAEVRQLDLYKQETDVNLLLRRASDMLEPMLEDKRLRFSLELDSSLPALQLDADRMNQAFYNILTNAVRYTKDGTTIHVTSRRQPDGACITITDEGPGIAPADLQYIFDHFYRGDKSRSRAAGGSGIGLALARQFVEVHGGSIWAESKAGQGTSVMIRLPFLHAPKQEE